MFFFLDLHEMTAYRYFMESFKLFVAKHPKFIENTLSNIFTMRLVGNKTHGDLAEIGIAEFINQFMYNFYCEHVGKDAYRAKEREEDILIIDEIHKTTIPVSLKAYGDGPLQLSTDKSALMFDSLRSFGAKIEGKDIEKVFQEEAFRGLDEINVLPLIYRESESSCNILVFDFSKMKDELAQIVFVDTGQVYNATLKQVVKDRGRKHPLYIFLNKEGEYMCEVRYGGKTANALQRGLWTHTKHAIGYFDSLTNGWVSYAHNHSLVELIRLALNTTEEAHISVNKMLKTEIEQIKKVW